jgi:FkbM family methyltransferase
MSLISFAQNQEDIMLWRALGHVRDGFYIDVGAADPTDLSVTKLFYDRGWSGINLEPQRTYFDLINAARPRDVNLSIAAGREATSLMFHRIDGTGLSTFDADIAAGHRARGWTVEEQTVELLPLDEICRRYCPQGPIHFLKVDAEGVEGDVLAGADFRAFRPWIVLVEATLPLSSEESYAGWEPILTSQGYRFAWFDGLNRFYLADEMAEELGKHFRVQPNVFDGFLRAPELAARAEQAEQALQRAREQAEAEARRVHDQAAEDMQRVRAQAEKEMQRVLEHATGTLQEAHSISRQAIRMVERLTQKASEANEQAAEAHQQAAEAMRQVQQMALALDQMAQSSNAALAEQTRLRAEALHVAHHAQAHVAALLRSTSWRITAPLRALGRLRLIKRLLVWVFRRGTKTTLWLPGGRLGIGAVRAIAPRLVDRLARRYHGYGRAVVLHIGQSLEIVLPTKPATVSAPPRHPTASWRPLAFEDLSADACRFYLALRAAAQV